MGYNTNDLVRAESLIHAGTDLQGQLKMDQAFSPLFLTYLLTPGPHFVYPGLNIIVSFRAYSPH